MTRKKTPPPPDPTLPRAARQLVDAADELARLSARAAEVRPRSHAELHRGLELLKKATAAHGRFVGAMQEMIGEVSVLRERHEGFAAVLEGVSARLDDRFRVVRALEDRFEPLTAAAREINELALSLPSSPSDAPAEERVAVLSAGIAEVRQRLAAAVEQADTLVTDAREAEFVDTERRATAIRDQLRALVGRLAGSVPPA